MLTYSPEYEVNSERVLYIQLSRPIYEGEYAQVVAKVLRRVKRTCTNPDTGHINHNDGLDAPEKSFRNASWSSGKKNALFIEDFAVSCYFNVKTKEAPYGVTSKFSDVHTIEVGEARQICRTLEKIEKEMMKLDNKFGYASGDYTAYLIRVASILGIKTFVTTDAPGGSYDNLKFKEWRATEVEWVVNNLINKERGIEE